MRYCALVLVVACSLCCPPAGAQATSQVETERPSCPGSDPESIVRSFGSVWNVADQRGIGLSESKEIITAVSAYYACYAYQEGRSGVCDQLKTLNTKALKIQGSSGLKSCNDVLEKIAFVNLVEFFLGRGEDAGACSKYFRSAGRVNDTGITEDEFCRAARSAAAEGNMGGLCPRLISPMGRMFMPECRVLFPAGPQDCVGKPDCGKRLAVHEAVSLKSWKSCPADYRPFCEMRGAKESGCRKAADNLQAAYCAAYRRAEKRLHGRVGLTDEDVKEMERINQRIRSRRGDDSGGATQ